MRPVLVTLICSLSLSGQTAGLPVSGPEVPELAVFDRTILEIMGKYGLPGGSLAVVDAGRLVLARGYGYADREANQGVQPFHLFRLASLSKTVTAVSVMKLVQDGKVTTDARLAELLPDLAPAPGQTADPRYRAVTVQQLLWHSFGSDSSAPPGDPAFRYQDAQRAFSGAPHTLTNMLRFGFGQPLQFDPGTRFAYSNLGYHLLGRIVEKVSGKPYETYVREEVLAPLGISAMRIGRTALSQRLTDEVKYYDHAAARQLPTLIAGASGNAPRQYGGSFLTEICESYGGWVASAVDMARFLTGIDGRRGVPALLNEATRRQMLARPPHASATAPTYYAMGFSVQPVDTRFSFWHSGSLPGTRTYIVSFANGRAYAVLFNLRPQASESSIAEGAADPFLQELNRNMNTAFGQVTAWPAHDLFPQLARETLNASSERLTFVYQVGGAAPPPQTLTLTSSGMPIYASAAPAAGTSWLRLDRAGGYTPASISVAVNPAGLQPGEYSAAINVVSTDARNSPRRIAVVLRVFADVAVRNAASLAPGPVAPESLVVAEGSGFDETASVRIGGVADVNVTERRPDRLTFVVPAGLPAGDTDLVVTTAGTELRSRVQIAGAAPGLFSADRSGRGVALASFQITTAGGEERSAPAFECAESGACTAVPLEIPEGASVVLRLAATGVRGVAGPSAITAKIGDADVEVAAVSPAEEPGRDTVTLRVPPELAGRGELDVVVTAGELMSNAVKIHLR